MIKKVLAFLVGDESDLTILSSIVLNICRKVCVGDESDLTILSSSNL